MDHRTFLLESGMLPNQSLTRKKVIAAARLFFRVNPRNTRLEIRRDQLSAVNAMKQYGLIQNDWLLALYPDDNHYITVILNLRDHTWSDDPESDYARHSPLRDLLGTLQQFYSGELSSWPRLARH